MDVRDEAPVGKTGRGQVDLSRFLQVGGNWPPCLRLIPSRSVIASIALLAHGRLDAPGLATRGSGNVLCGEEKGHVMRYAGALIAVVFVTINLVVDLLYYAVDPRLRVGRGRGH